MSAVTLQKSQALSQAAAAHANVRGTPREVLSFKLGAEEYGIDMPESAGDPRLRAAHPHRQGTADAFGAGDCALKAVIGPWRAHDAPASTRLDAALSCGWSGHSPLGLTLAGSRADGETDKLMGRNGKTTLLMPRDDRVAASTALDAGLQARIECWRGRRVSAWSLTAPRPARPTALRARSRRRRAVARSGIAPPAPPRPAAPR